MYFWRTHGCITQCGTPGYNGTPGHRLVHHITCDTLLFFFLLLPLSEECIMLLRNCDIDWVVPHFVDYSLLSFRFLFNLYPFQTDLKTLKTRNVLLRTFRVHPRPLSVWKVAGWSPPGEHGTNSGWTRREIRARLSSTNTERPPEDVPCLPQTAASMKSLGTHTVCKPEPEIPEWTLLVHVSCSFCMIIMHKCMFILNERELSGCRAIWSKCLINLHNNYYSFILTK